MESIDDVRAARGHERTTLSATSATFAAPRRDWPALLQTVVAYRNEQVLFRFRRHFAVTQAQAAGLLAETMKWLWLCEYNRQANPSPVALRIDTPIRIIDEMWHNLVLHTAEYRRLCDEYFGAYVDHFPATAQDHSDYAAQKEAMTHADFVAARRARARAQYELVHATLGADTFRTWYVEFPLAYSTDAIRGLRR